MAKVTFLQDYAGHKAGECCEASDKFYKDVVSRGIAIGENSVASHEPAGDETQPPLSGADGTQDEAPAVDADLADE